MSALLVITAGPDRGRSFPLTPGTTLQVGRSQATATQLTDASVSRVHCEIEFDGARAVLINISTNGTQINGKPAAQAELKPGDVIRVGSTEMRYQLAGAEAPTAPPRPVAVDLASLPGQTLAHYAIDSVIGRGATGVVFKAHDTQHGGRVVALKVLQPEFSSNDEDMQRFIRAIKTVLPLRHENLVTLYGAGKTGGFCWVAMEHVEGESMAERIKSIGVAGMLDWKYGYRVAVHIARALDYAHGQSIIHRNVTPTNILWRAADKTALLGDLMYAKAMEGALAKQVTRPGQLVGDIAYMAPERTTGSTDVDGRADLYGLGATVYALVAGRPPFTGSSLPELIGKIRNTEPEKPKKYQMAIPDLFQGTVMKLLAKVPEQRFQSAAELLTDLERVGKFAGVTV
jgi:serine/threonine protein kinase